MPILPNLYQIRITFNTHGEDDRDSDTVLHVFIKNRTSDTFFSNNNSDYISNLLAWQKYVGTPATPEAPGGASGTDPFDRDPYLAYGENLAASVAFGNGSSFWYEVPLRPTAIPCGEIILPVVNIHILPNGDDTWVFDYTVKFYFADPLKPDDPNHAYDFSFSSSTNGESGIILSHNNRNYVGIGTENPHRPVVSLPKPNTDSVLTNIGIDFITSSGSKLPATQLNVRVANRVSATVSLDMGGGQNLFNGEALPLPTPTQTSQSPNATTDLALTSAAVQLKEIVLPVVTIILVPDPQDGSTQGRWIFDFRVRYFFNDGNSPKAFLFESTTSGICLDPSENQFTCIYQGDSFPTVAQPTAKLTPLLPADNLPVTKKIPFSFLSQKLDEFINTRQGLDLQSPIASIFKLRLHNSGVFGSATPANYYDVQTINAGPPLPNTAVPSDFVEGVTWDHNPTDFGTEEFRSVAGIYLNEINSQSIKLTVDPIQPDLLTLSIVFQPTTSPNIVGTGKATAVGTWTFSDFSITLKLTLMLDSATNSRIDILGWVYDLTHPNKNVVYTNLPPLPDGQAQVQVTGTFLGQPVNFTAPSQSEGQTTLLEQALLVKLTIPGVTSPGGILRQLIRDELFAKLSTPDNITHETIVDSLNSLMNAWFLGGTVDIPDHGVVPGPIGGNICKVQSVKPDPTGQYLQITYTGPQYRFEFEQPPGWPSANETDPGPLANIDHIVVLMMENRSFDQMLGYLSLPPGPQGGMGRTDVDGLKGGEVNLLDDGTVCPSTPFPPGQTVFTPDPPHGFEPVGRAINNGKMDGFARSYADYSGNVVGPNIMKYYTANHVPTYDALVRDFALCQRWFAAHPGSTFPNRFHAMTGRLNIDEYGIWELNNSNPRQPVFTDTIFDHLTDAGVSWKYFEQSYSFLRFFEKYTFNDSNIVSFDEPGLGFMNVIATGNLPSVTYIDPHFIELPPGGDCDGPPADVRQGQLFVQQVVNAVVTSPNWNKTMLIITYDEHGGFYDHVPPPPAAQIAPGLPSTYGVRIPTFVISPWVTGGLLFGNDAAGQTPSAFYDHTSVLKTIAKRFLSSKPPYMGPRFAAANDLSSLMNAEVRPDALLPFIPYNLLFSASQKRLDVKGANIVAGTPLWQFAPNNTNAQQFSFEDASDGYFYIRTHTGSLYVTADVPASGTSQLIGIKQDVKYAVGGKANPDSQLWGFIWLPTEVNSGVQIVTIHNKVVPGTTLHPTAQSTDSEAAVVLEAVTGESIGVFGDTAYVWEITSPLIPNKSGIVGPIGPPPVVAVVPSSLAFPTQQIGTRSDQQTVTVEQQPVPGVTPLAITAIALLDSTGAASADFASVPPPGSPPPAGSINIQNGQLVITVWFIPTAAGTRNTTLQISHNQPGSPLTVQLSGTGNPEPLPLLSFSPGSLFFDPKKLTNHTVTLGNTGSAPLTISSIVIADSNYSMSNTCNVGAGGGTLQPGQQCTVNVICHFIGLGGTSQMVITHNAAVIPTVIELNATSKGGVDS
jgi:phospholipase C